MDLQNKIYILIQIFFIIIFIPFMVVSMLLSLIVKTIHAFFYLDEEENEKTQKE
jgi:hypothetical protein